MGDVYGLPLDFDDFVNSVRTFSMRYLVMMMNIEIEDNDSIKIDVLMNNAGAGFKSKELTMDGYERTFQACHLGHFLLTACLKKENLLNDDFNDTNNISNRSKKATGSTTTIDDNESSLAHQTARLVNEDKDDDGVQFGLDFNNLN